MKKLSMYISGLLAGSVLNPVFATTEIDPSILEGRDTIGKITIPSKCDSAICMEVEGDYILDLEPDNDEIPANEGTVVIKNPNINIVYPLGNDNPIYDVIIASGVPLKSTLEDLFISGPDSTPMPWYLNRNGAYSDCQGECSSSDSKDEKKDSEKDKNEPEKDNNKDSDSKNENGKEDSKSSNSEEKSNTDVMLEVVDRVATMFENMWDSTINGWSADADVEVGEEYSVTENGKTVTYKGKSTYSFKFGKKGPGKGKNNFSIDGWDNSTFDISIVSSRDILSDGIDLADNPWREFDSFDFTSGSLNAFSIKDNSFVFNFFSDAINKNGLVYLGGDLNALSNELVSRENPMNLTLLDLANMSQIKLVDLMSDPIVGSKLAFIPLGMLYSENAIHAKLQTLNTEEDMVKFRDEMLNLTLGSMVAIKGFDSITLHEFLSDPSINDQVSKLRLLDLLDEDVVSYALKKNNDDSAVDSVLGDRNNTGVLFDENNAKLIDSKPIDPSLTLCSSNIQFCSEMSIIY
ncbi:hypothetical protein ACU6DI_000510 [Vibrio navarrensis]